MSELGLMLYASLDFGLGEHEERSLSEQLEALLETMVAANNGLTQYFYYKFQINTKYLYIRNGR